MYWFSFGTVGSVRTLLALRLLSECTGFCFFKFAEKFVESGFGLDSDWLRSYKISSHIYRFLLDLGRRSSAPSIIMIFANYDRVSLLTSGDFSLNVSYTVFGILDRNGTLVGSMLNQDGCRAR